MSKVPKNGVLGYADKPVGFILAIMGAILFSLLAAGVSPDRESHGAVLTALREIDAANSSLQRDVLQARSGLLNNYDTLVTPVARLHEMLSRLTELSAAEWAIGSRLETPLARLTSSVDRVDTLVERFKTNNAILQNSLGVFNNVLSDLYSSPLPTPNLPAEWDELGNLMFRFSSHATPELSTRIERLLKLPPPTDQFLSEKIGSVVAHGQTILNVQPSVDEQVSQIQASDVTSRTQDLQREYLSAYGGISLRAALSRLFLGAVAVTLCLYSLVLVYRLRSQTNRLSRRLKFENCRNVIKATFDEDISTGGTEAINSSLVAISEFFETARYTFLVFNTDTGGIVEKVESDPSSINWSDLIQDFLIETRSEPATEAVASGRFCKSLQSQSEMPFTRDSLSAGMVVGMPISKRHAAMLIFEYSDSIPRASIDDITLMQDALEVLTRCIDRLRKNQERDILENRLEHAERLQAVGTLAAGIAHEFNNILVFMLGYGEMALQTIKPSTEARRYIDGIISAGEQARRVIDQILALSRKRERSSRPFDLSKALSGITSLLSVSLPEGFKISVKLPSEPMVILGNPVEIQQIIVNLGNNAVEATAGSGQLRIDIEPIEICVQRVLSHGLLPPGNYIRLRVVDNGPGIAESVMPHIFEPFFTTKPLAGGTGLGLSTVHGHIVAHAGYVDVSSTIGVSTQFDIFFPKCDQPAVPLESFFDQDVVPLGKGEIIALVEAEDALRLMHEEKLAALSYEPIGFRTVDEVLLWLQSKRAHADLIILDVASLSQNVRPHEINQMFPDIPYVLIADQQRSGELSPFNLKGLSTLKRPIDLKDLANTINEQIKSRNG
jgi:signal transduction histidine kinase